jgi:hypothetical protein
MADRGAIETLLERTAITMAGVDVDALAGAVGDRIRTEPAPPMRPTWRRPMLIVAAAAAVIAIIVAILPTTREAVADLLGFGGVRISSDAPTGGPYTGLQLGRPVTLADAQEAVDFPVKLPSAAGYGQPDAVFFSPSPPVDMVSLVYRPSAERPPSPVAPVGVLISEFRARPDFVFAKKLTAAGTDVRFLTLDGVQAVWIGGPAHEFSYVRPDGTEDAERIRLAANTLLWARDGITYRLESALGLDESVAIARSMS